MSVKTFIKGTFILTLAGIITRCLGFFFKIYLSRIIGAEGIGLYQLILPLNAIGYAIAISGFEVAVSKLTATQLAKKDFRGAYNTTLSALFYSLLISICCCIVITTNAEFIAKYAFDNPKCAPLIKILALALPFSSIHCMVTSYCLGQEKTFFPGISQLLEQLIRMAAVYFVIKITKKTDASIGVICLVVGEIGATVISVTYLIFAYKKAGSPRCPAIFKSAKEIFSTYFPISGNRILLYGLQSIEILLLPKLLLKSGLNYNEALSILGIISGMAIPLILFPATLSNSVALMLLPNVAKNRNNTKTLLKTGNSALIFSVLFGFVCIIFFITIGGKFGAYCFKEPELKNYIMIMAWLCPFIFLSTTFKSILNALGKSTQVFANNMLSEILCIIFITVCIPLWGIRAYMFGLLINQVINALLQLRSYHSYMKKQLHTVNFSN